MPNRLATATSPYLLQHKDNPVDWWEWGPDAFSEAVRRDVPLLVSIGYAACHWCHVMAHESFEDAEVATYLNQHFVAVKVDREERPDVDATYMTATQALTGHGGWPMTVFTTPDGRPFYAGTYFPPTPRHGVPSFRQLLEAINGAWTTQRGEVADAAARIGAALSEIGPQASRGELDRVELEDRSAAAVDELAASYDVRRGGFGDAPKFPPSVVLEFLLRHHARTGDPRALAMVEGTCEAMARGGLYDQLAGGFARYSVDADWVVPHFEKMLYDNALLLSAYTALWRDTRSPLAERVVRDTVRFLLSDLRTPDGGFASSLDADTDGREGLTYVWTPAELVAALGPDDGGWASALLGITPAGTFEHGASVLQLRDEPSDAQRWERVRRTLLDVRAARAQPARDDKVVSAWNGWTVSALAWAGALFEEPDWVEAAAACADLLVALHLDAAGRVCRVSRDGVAGRPAGVLEDHAAVAEGLLALHQVTGDPEWLAIGGRVLDVVLARFRDPATGGFFDTADDAEQLVLRPQDPTDNATPSGAAAAAGALLGYAALTGSSTHRVVAEESLAAAPVLPARFAGGLLAVCEAWLDGPREVAVVGPEGPARAALRRVALRSSAPGRVVSVGVPDADGVPLLADRPLVIGDPAAYVCRHFVCDAPVTTPEALARVLGNRLTGERSAPYPS